MTRLSSILEDWTARNDFTNMRRGFPTTGDAIFPGGIHPDDPVPVSPGVAKLTDAFSTYAYGLRSKAYAAFLSDAETQMRPVDHTTRAMQPRFPVLLLYASPG
jgi:hypothetical protein